MASEDGFLPWKQKGVTFLEILAVLVILVLIYLAYARSFGAGNDKAKLSDVQNSFKQFQIAFENAFDERSGLPSGNGVNVDYSLLNQYLNKDFQITSPTNGTGSTHPTANPLQISKLKDPWGNVYWVQAYYVSNQESLLMVRSSGEDKQSTVTNDIFNYNVNSPNADTDDILFVTDYKNGVAKSCTKGLSKDLATMEMVLSDIPFTYNTNTRWYQNGYKSRSAYYPTNSYEYTLLFQAPASKGGQIFRSYAYANTPLNFVISGSNLKDASGTPFTFFEWWQPATSPLTLITGQPSQATAEPASGVNLQGMTFLGATLVNGQDNLPVVLGCN